MRMNFRDLPTVDLVFSVFQRTAQENIGFSVVLCPGPTITLQKLEWRHCPLALLFSRPNGLSGGVVSGPSQCTGFLIRALGLLNSVFGERRWED